MAVLNFDQVDKSVVEQYYLENREILTFTAIKEQCLYKPENWWYFFTILDGEKNQEFREYILKTLKKMAPTSLSLSTLYLLISEKGSLDEKSAMEIIRAQINAIRGKLRTQTVKSLYACSEVGDRMLKIT